MRTKLALSLLLLAVGCSGSSDTFTVQVSDPAPVSAAVNICGKETTLSRIKAGVFSSSRRITCEGSGDIRVVFADRLAVCCPIGYVTSLHQDWSFIVKDGACEALLEKDR
jgi:hypothetical protein